MSLKADARTAVSAAEQVARLSQAVKALGSYTVRFTVTMGEYKNSGEYTVGDERYTLWLGNIEVYGEAECRYEVDTSRKEIAIDKVDKSSHNILNNPLSAFDFIGDEYLAEIASQSADNILLRLTPREGGAQGGFIELSINPLTSLPRGIVYHLSGDAVRVDIDHIGSTSVAPAKFDGEKFKGFEIIDFR